MSWTGLALDDEDDLLREFEKLLDGEDNNYEGKKMSQEQKHCYHVWEKSGQSIHMKDGEYWYNCKQCGMKKEDYEKKNPPKEKRKDLFW